MNMNKKRLLFILCGTALLIALLVACQAAPPRTAPPHATPSPTAVATQQPTWKWPDRILLGGTTTASASYAAYLAWGTPLSQDTGMDVRVVSEPNMPLRYRYTKEKRYFVCVIFGGGRHVIEADGPLATRDLGPWQVRVIYPSSKVEHGFAVARDSGIKTPKDVKPGTRLIYAAWLPEKEAKASFMALLAWANLKETDVEWVPAASMAALTRLLMDGKGDILFGVHPTSPLMYEVEASPRGLAWITLDPQADPEGARRFLDKYDDMVFGPITAGVSSAVGVKSLNAISCYLGSADQDVDLVYNVVKWLHVNWEKYRKAHAWCEAMTIDNLMRVAETDYIPLHDGTVKYLKELGKWTPAHEARRQQNISLITKYVDAFQKTVQEADNKGIMVSPDNKEWLEMWAKARAQLPPIKAFTGLN